MGMHIMLILSTHTACECTSNQDKYLFLIEKCLDMQILALSWLFYDQQTDSKFKHEVAGRLLTAN